METKNDDVTVLDKLKDLHLNYESHFVVSPARPGSGGLILLWKKELKIQISTFNKNLIDTIVTFKELTFHVSFIYGEPEAHNRHIVWDSFSHTFSGRSGPWFVTGDLNEIIDNGEKSGGPRRTEGSFSSFRNFLAQHDLFDLKHSGNFLS